MKLLLITMGLDIGGAETHIVELACELKRRGYDVVVASNGGVYVEELEGVGIKHYTVPLHTKNPVCMLKSCRLLKKILKEEKIRLVHAHARIPAFIAGKMCRKLGIPFVTTAHWVFSTRFGLKYITDWGEKTVAVSEDIKRYLIDNYKIASSDITVTINGINTNKFSSEIPFDDVAEEFGIRKDAFRIVHVSRIDYSREAVAFILAKIMPEIKKIIPNAQLIIVGGGNAFDDLKAVADSPDIILAGPRRDINKFVSAADLFVGVSRAALEAMAAGKPAIVAGNEGDIGLFSPEKLEEAIAGNFCCRGCPLPTGESILSSIKEYYNLPEAEKNALSEFCHHMVSTRYSVKKMADDTEIAYNTVFKGYDAVLSGYYGFKNSGDEALLRSIISDLKKVREDVKIAVLSDDPEFTKSTYGVDSFDRMRFSEVKRVLKYSKLLISGGGSLIQDATSSKSLYYYLAVIKLAKKCGAKVFVYANGVGPVKRFLNRKLTKRVLNTVDMVTLRDEDSKDELLSIGVTKPEIQVTADPALGFSIPECKKQLKAELFGDKKGILVSVRSWKRCDERIISAVSGFVKSFSSEGYEVVLLPMQYSKDEKICTKIAENTGCKVLKDGYTFEDVLGIISNCSLVVGMRLHAIIYSVTASCPVAGIVYDPKVESFMKYVGIEDFVDVYNITEENLISAAKSAMSAQGTADIERLSKLAFKNAEIAVELMKD